MAARILVGQSAPLSFTDTDGAAVDVPITTVQFSVSPQYVGRVSGGHFIAMAVGSAQVTAVFSNGTSVSEFVNVYPLTPPLVLVIGEP